MPSKGLFPGINLCETVTVIHFAFDLREPICTLLYAMPTTQALNIDCIYKHTIKLVDDTLL